MKAVTTVLFAALLSGCVHRVVYVPDSAPACEADGDYGDDPAYADDPVYDDEGVYAVEDECDPCWDGHAWIEITIPHHVHGSACGHFFHHGCWHLYPASHFYLQFGWACFGETGGFYSHGDACARVWDGCEFTFIRHHVCGPGCGHFFHHGCWNTCSEDHAWSDSRHFHLADHAPVFHPGHAESHHEASRGPRESKGDVHPPKPSREAARAPATRPGGRSMEERKRPGVQPEKVEPPKRRAPPPQLERFEQPRRQDPPPQRERIEHPRRQDPPPQRERIEQPKRQDPPPQREKIEQPKRQDPPPQREKIEQPRRQDPPPQREKIEQPKRQDSPPQREKIEQPKRQDPPPKRKKAGGR